MFYLAVPYVPPTSVLTPGSTSTASVPTPVAPSTGQPLALPRTSAKWKLRDNDGNQVCRFNLMDKCTKGADCTFSHADPKPDFGGVDYLQPGGVASLDPYARMSVIAPSPIQVYDPYTGMLTAADPSLYAQPASQQVQYYDPNTGYLVGGTQTVSASTYSVPSTTTSQSYYAQPSPAYPPSSERKSDYTSPKQNAYAPSSGSASGSKRDRDSRDYNSSPGPSRDIHKKVKHSDE